MGSQKQWNEGDLAADGQAIKRIRKDLRLTQEYVGLICEWSPATQSAIEKSAYPLATDAHSLNEQDITSLLNVFNKEIKELIEKGREDLSEVTKFDLILDTSTEGLSASTQHETLTQVVLFEKFMEKGIQKIPACKDLLERFRENRQKGVITVSLEVDNVCLAISFGKDSKTRLRGTKSLNPRLFLEHFLRNPSPSLPKALTPQQLVVLATHFGVSPSSLVEENTDEKRLIQEIENESSL